MSENNQVKKLDKNPYDFILDSGKTKKSGIFNPNSSKKSRIIFVVTSALILITLFITAMSLIGRASRQNTERLVGLVQEQNEIVRIAKIGVNKAQSSSTNNLAINTKLSIETSQKQLTDFLSSRGYNIDQKVLVKKQKSSNDKTLADAATNGRFDEVFVPFIKNMLAAHQLNIKHAYNKTSDKKEQTILSNSYNSVGILIGNESPNK